MINLPVPFLGGDLADDLPEDPRLLRKALAEKLMEVQQNFEVLSSKAVGSVDSRLFAAVGDLVTFNSGIVSSGSTGATFGPFSHGLGQTPDLIVGSCQGASNSQSNRPAAAQWGFYDMSSTQFSIEIIADPVDASVTWRGFAVLL